MKKEGWSVGNLGDGLPRLRRGENGLPRQCEHWLAMTRTKPFPRQAAAALPLEIGAIKN